MQLRIVFSLLHAGYLRHYAEPIRILAGRGHTVQIALHRIDPKDRGDERLLERLLADCDTVSVAPAPRRHRLDGWRPLASIVRSVVDVLRYAEPRYRDAPALRSRAAARLRTRIEAAHIDPVSRGLLLRLARSIEKVRDPARLGRILRLLAAIEEAIPPSRRTAAFIAKHRADVVLASPVVEFGSPQVEFVKSARELRIPSAVCVASWDNLTTKGLLRVAPDRVIVWNERQRDELAEMHGIPPERVVLTGGQKFDPWFALTASTTPDEFASRVGLDAHRPYVLYVCSSTFIAPDEVATVRRWLEAVRGAEGELGEIGVLIRPHPQNASQWAEVDFSAFGNVAIWPRRGEFPDEQHERAGFFDSVFHSRAVVGVNTSAQIEAAIVGRPVYTLLSPDYAAAHAGSLHFGYLRRENGGFIHEAATMDEHLDQLRDGVDGSGPSHEATEFIASFIRPHGLDEPVAPLLADAIERLAEVSVPESSRSPVRLVALRAALRPLAFALAALSAPGALRARRDEPSGGSRLERPHGLAR